MNFSDKLKEIRILPQDRNRRSLFMPVRPFMTLTVRSILMSGSEARPQSYCLPERMKNCTSDCPLKPLRI